jgi:hypothetical protein
LLHHFAGRVAAVREVVAIGREHTHAAPDDGRKVGQIVARNMVASANSSNRRARTLIPARRMRRLITTLRGMSRAKNPPDMPSGGLNLVEAMVTS